MAIGLGARRRSSDDELAETHEINVTPFIDVVLVLLIIFMVAAPLSTVDLDIDLPASTATAAPKPDTPVTLTVAADRSLSLGETPLPRGDIAGALAAATSGDHDRRIFLRADRGISYGDLMEVMNLLRDAGYLKIALVGIETPPAAAK